MSELNDFLPGMDIRNRTTFQPSEMFNAINSLTPNVDRALVLRVAQLSDAPNAAAIATTPKFGRMILFNISNQQLYSWTGSAWTALPSGQVSSASLITNGIITAAKFEAASAGNRVWYWNGSAWSALLVSDLFSSGGIPLDKIATGAEGSFLRVVSGARAWDSLANVTAAIIASITSYDITKLSNRIASAILVTDASSVASWQTASAWFTSLAAKIIPVAKLLGSSVARQVPMDDGAGNLVMGTLPISISNGGVLAGSALGAADNSFAFVGVKAALGNQDPKLLRTVLVCTSAELGYSVDDEVEAYCVDGNNGVCGISTVYLKATGAVNVNFNFDTATYMPNSTGARVPLDGTKWKVKLYAYA